MKSSGKNSQQNQRQINSAAYVNRHERLLSGCVYGSVQRRRFGAWGSNRNADNLDDESDRGLGRVKTYSREGKRTINS